MITLLFVALAAPPENPAPVLNPTVRLGAMRFNLGGQHNYFAVSPDGKTIATSSHESRETVIWDVPTGQPTTRFKGYSCLAYSPDGRTLAALGAAADGKAMIHLLDAATGNSTGALPIGDWNGEFTAFAGDGTLVWAGYQDQQFHIWDLKNKTETRTLPRPGRYYPKAETISPDGKFLAVINRADQPPYGFHVFEIATEKEVASTTFPTSPFVLCYSPDGKSVTCFGKITYRYDLATGKIVGSWTITNSNLLSGSFVCSDDGPFVLTSAGETLSTYDVAAGRDLGALPLTPVSVAGQSTPTDRLVTIRGSRLEVWHLKSGNPLHLPGDHRLPLTGVAFAPDGHPITADETTVRHWSPTGDRQKIIPCESNYRIYASALSADGRLFFNGDAVGKFRVWDAGSGKEIGSLTGAANVSSYLAVSPTGTALAFPGWTGLHVWDVPAAKLLWDTGRPLTGWNKVSAAFSPDGRTVYSGESNGSITEWNVATGKASRDLVGDPQFMPRPDPNAFAIRRVEPHPGHQGSVLALAVSPDGRRLLSAGSDQTIRVWETATGKECAVLDKEAGPVFSNSYSVPYPLAVSPTRSLLAAPGREAARRHLIDLWDYSTGKRVATLDGHTGPVTALAFSADGARLISGGADTTALIWMVPNRPSEPERLADATTFSAFWTELGDKDAVKAFRAFLSLAGMPDRAVAVARERLQPAQGLPAAEFDALVADLDAALFQTREQATRKLTDAGSVLDDKLRSELGKTASPEVVKRIKAILADHAAEEFRNGRVVELVESIGTPAAVGLLTAWAKGNHGATLTKEAARSLKRIESVTGTKK
jgi:WD40 repeat protein